MTRSKDFVVFPRQGAPLNSRSAWDDAQAYARWLSERTGKRYRLPTEAEWEYAARAKTTTARFWGDNAVDACQYANVDDQTHKCKDGYPFTAPVGMFKPNDFGAYDMLGNVWEWVQDCWHGNYKDAPTDGSTWGEQQGGVLRPARDPRRLLGLQTGGRSLGRP